METYSCLVAGATGAVGQKLLTYLGKEEYRLFEVTDIAASERSKGKTLEEAIGRGFFEQMDVGKPSKRILDMEIKSLEDIDTRDYDIIFSALSSEAAELYETGFAEKTPTFTSASLHRDGLHALMHAKDINDDHLKLIDIQRRERVWEGFIIAKQNCVAAGLTCSIKTILDNYGIELVRVYTEQALSGAGRRGLAEDSEYRKMVKRLGKYPFIQGEDEKVKREPRRVLGRFADGRIEDAPFEIDAYCTRVARENVHQEDVFIITERDFELDELKQKMSDMDAIVLWDKQVVPEDHVKRYGTMKVAVGEFEKPKAKELTYTLTVDNTGYGAAGEMADSAKECVEEGFI